MADGTVAALCEYRKHFISHYETTQPSTEAISDMIWINIHFIVTLSYMHIETQVKVVY